MYRRNKRSQKWPVWLTQGTEGKVLAEHTLDDAKEIKCNLLQLREAKGPITQRDAIITWSVPWRQRVSGAGAEAFPSKIEFIVCEPRAKLPPPLWAGVWVFFRPRMGGACEKWRTCSVGYCRDLPLSLLSSPHQTPFPSAGKTLDNYTRKYNDPAIRWSSTPTAQGVDIEGELSCQRCVGYCLGQEGFFEGRETNYWPDLVFRFIKKKRTPAVNPTRNLSPSAFLNFFNRGTRLSCAQGARVCELPSSGIA